MIESLRIEQLAIVDEVELEFALVPGLNVLTGETGAGKSVVLGALALLAGGRAPADALREGAARGCVEAVVRTDGLPEFEADLAALGIEPEARGEEPGCDGPARELTVQRSLLRGARSRARVGGELVPIAKLAELLGPRIEISSQHSGLSLLRPEEHGRLLDASGGLLPDRARVEQALAALRQARTELDSLRAAEDERERQRDFLAYELDEIEAAGLVPGELDALEVEQRRLAHGEELREQGRAALALLAGDTHDGDGGGAVDRVAQAQRVLESIAKLDPGLASLAERVMGLDVELRDASADLERAVAGFEGDPARLAEVDERLAQLERVRRKYGPGEAEVFATRDRLAGKLAAIAEAGDRAAELETACRRAEDELREAATVLSRGRKRAARALRSRVETALRELEMPDACFRVALEASPPPADLPGAACGRTGAESPEFLFSANPGQEPRPLRRVASGGELSRVYLAIKNALRSAGRAMVLVFDEVDSGIGGGVAERVGRVLAELACQHQVLCITHLPQIAALADRHFRVQKRVRDGRVAVSVEVVEGDERIDEIARMAGGSDISQATRRHARSLLESSSR